MSLFQSKNKKTGFSHTLKELLTSLNMYNKVSLLNLISYVKGIPQETYYVLEDHEKEILLDILALDEENFNIIKNMMLKDEDSCYKYLHYLLSINKMLAIKHFHNFIYNRISKKRSIWLEVKLFFGIYTEPKCHKYDNPKINPKKIQKFLCFMNAMTRHNFEDIDSITLKMALLDYYQFFNDYIRPEGTFSPDIYYDMNSKISDLWTYLESSTKHIDLLNELSNIKINNISNRAKYYLDIVYKLQGKERNITNSFYKEIFDKKPIVEHKTIINHGNYTDTNNGQMSVK